MDKNDNTGGRFLGCRHYGSLFRNPCKFFDWYDPEFPSQSRAEGAVDCMNSPSREGDEARIWSFTRAVHIVATAGPGLGCWLVSGYHVAEFLLVFCVKEKMPAVGRLVLLYVLFAGSFGFIVVGHCTYVWWASGFNLRKGRNGLEK
ncbi:hypothetical protein H5410_041801 [Solanum commersonii]|uniref:Zinc finger GRF-type domain-containing protein n=1 Tax=Solanum commersonii TaxID=4109 RepID=A0A9J5XUM0_SOLCO|nr:hypothetical protein H5410_041801 [Solanum commersonii]